MPSITFTGANSEGREVAKLLVIEDWTMYLFLEGSLDSVYRKLERLHSYGPSLRGKHWCIEFDTDDSGGGFCIGVTATDLHRVTCFIAQYTNMGTPSKELLALFEQPPQEPKS